VSRVALPAANPERDTTLVGAWDGGRMVGASIVLMPTQENLHTVGLDVYVDPARRREGLGTALLADVEDRARAAGRTTLQAEVYSPPDSASPGQRFGLARGFAVASREGLKHLDLADYLRRRPALVEQVGGAAEGYRIVTFDTVCPEEHLAGFGRLLSTLIAEIPLGDLDLSDSEWTPERLRAAERRWTTTGRHVLTALAIAPDGSVAGSSDARVNEADPVRGDVGVTLVARPHRGHRLGLALKLATHDLVLATYPSVRSVGTMNAESNAHMNAVNEQLGYRKVETLLEMQKRLPIGQPPW
jgi:GNAT superfamily N-acetyltransferase